MSRGTAENPGTTEAEAATQQRIREIVSEELDIEQDELEDTADFMEAYDADSLSLITVAARIEKELRIAIPTEEWSTLTNLEQVFVVIAKHAGNSQAGELGA